MTIMEICLGEAEAMPLDVLSCPLCRPSSSSPHAVLALDQLRTRLPHSLSTPQTQEAHDTARNEATQFKEDLDLRERALSAVRTHTDGWDRGFLSVAVGRSDASTDAKVVNCSAPSGTERVHKVSVSQSPILDMTEHAGPDMRVMWTPGGASPSLSPGCLLWQSLAAYRFPNNTIPCLLPRAAGPGRVQRAATPARGGCDRGGGLPARQRAARRAFATGGGSGDAGGRNPGCPAGQAAGC